MNMNRQLPLPQYTQQQADDARQKILAEVKKANLPTEVLIEIGQWAQQVIENPALFPEFQAWLKSRGLDDKDIPDQPDYQELTSMVVIGQVAGDIKAQEPEPQPQTAGPVQPIAPDQMPQIAAAGRNGDTMLAHINAEEAQMLKSMGGTGTINPATGLPEYGFFKDLWNGIKKVAKAVAPFALPIVALTMPTLIPAIGTALGASTALAPIVGTAVIAGGATALSGGSVKDVLKSATLTGLGAYLTPIVGKYVGGLTGVESPTLQAVLGSAVFSGGVTAARGGSVAQILTSAATGAAASYLGQVATNAINSGKITNTRIDQGTFDDAVFAAADAKGLADQGLNKAQITRILESTGLSTPVAASAAAMAVAGNSADTMAIALSNSYGGTTINGQKTLYTNGADGAQNSVIGGANARALEQVQKVEDAMLVTQDAKNLYDTLQQQGITGRAAQAPIRQNLIAAGVDPAAAEYISDSIVSNYTVQATANGVNQYLGTAELFGTARPDVLITADKIGAKATGNLAQDIDFVVADVKNLQQQGMSSQYIERILVDSGVDPVLARTAAQYSAQSPGVIKNFVTQTATQRGLEVFPNFEPPAPAAPTTPTAPTAPGAEVTPVTPPPAVTPEAPVAPVTPGTGTTSQTFDDGSVLITDNATGRPIGGTDATGAPINIPAPPAPQPVQPTAPTQPALNTDAGSARIRAENLLRMNPDFNAQQVENFLVNNGFDPAVARSVSGEMFTVAPTPAPTTPAPTPPAAPTNLSTNVQVFDDGSVLITGSNGQVIGTVNDQGIASNGLNLRKFDDGSFIITTIDNNIVGGLDAGGNIFGLNEQGQGVYQGQRPLTPTTPPTPEPPPAPTTPTTPPAGIDVSTNVQVFDDGSVLITGSDGRVLGTINDQGASSTLGIQRFDDGSYIIFDSQNEIVGGVDAGGNIFGINATGQGVYQGTRTPLTQPPAELPVVTPPAEGGYGEGFPENIDISGSTPPPTPPVVPPAEPPGPIIDQPLPDEIPHSDEPKEPVTPEVPFIPPYVPPEPTPPGPRPRGTYVPAPPDPRWLTAIPLPGLNPGFMEQGVRPMYETTSPVQAQYYWGKQPYMQNMADLMNTYNQVPGAPAQPWGATRGWWETPMDYSQLQTRGPDLLPVRPGPTFAQPAFNAATPTTDFRAQANQMIPVAPALQPYYTYTPATQGQYYDAAGNPVSSL